MRILTIILSLFATSLLLAQETPQQLVGYYPFEETTGLGHDGEIMNAARGVKRGLGGRAPSGVQGPSPATSAVDVHSRTRPRSLDCRTSRSQRRNAVLRTHKRYARCGAAG